MVHEDRFEKDFNPVDNLTALCRENSSYLRGDYPELEIGKTYRVTHIGVFRSRTDLILEGFGHKDYNAACFDLYEDGEPLGRDYTRDFRFLAPYLKEMIRMSSPERYAERLKEVDICAHLRGIQKEYSVKILLAILGGSRAMGLESKNSDWDVYFLYVHKPEWYEQPGEHGAEIKQVFDDGVDTYGWELKDALSYLGKGNPTIVEWLNSPEIYMAKAPLCRGLREIWRAHFNPGTAIRHYNQVYSKLNERFIQENGNLKEFLYYLRGVLACKWIEIKGTLPPMNFTELVDKTVGNEESRAIIKDLVKTKRNCENYDKDVIDAGFIETAQQWAEYCDALEQSAASDPTPALQDNLDSLFKEMLQQQS